MAYVPQDILKDSSAFAEAEDLRPDSSIMYAHQKCKNGNEAIEEYMAREYIVPTDFDDYVYLSQLQAGEIMRYTTCLNDVLKRASKT